MENDSLDGMLDDFDDDFDSDFEYDENEYDVGCGEFPVDEYGRFVDLVRDCIKNKKRAIVKAEEFFAGVGYGDDALLIYDYFMTHFEECDLCRGRFENEPEVYGVLKPGFDLRITSLRKYFEEL
jgi:hypothetical protein